MSVNVTWALVRVGPSQVMSLLGLTAVFRISEQSVVAAFDCFASKLFGTIVWYIVGAVVVLYVYET